MIDSPDEANQTRPWRRATVVTVAYFITIGLLYSYTLYIVPLVEMAGGETHLDVRWGGYTYEVAHDYLSILGEEGRAFYAKTTFFDTVWPLAVALSAALMAPVAFASRRSIILGAFLPVAFGVLDLFENIGLWTMLAQYPDLTPEVVSATNVITVTKQAMIPGAAIAFLILPFIALVRTFVTRR